MTAQVMFINTCYYPSFEESMRLFNLQQRLELSLAELSFATRDYSDHEKYMSKLRYHNGFRERLKLLHGFKENKDKIVENC